MEGINIIDYKLERSHEAFGELVIHLQNLYESIREYCDHKFSVKGGLACKDGIWLVTLEKDTVYRAEILAWTDGGGQNKLKEFFAETNPFACVTDELLTSLNMEFSEKDGTPFLGIGACGCVVLVQNVDQQEDQSKIVQALKVVYGDSNVALLKAEFATNQEILQVEKAESVIVKASSMTAAHTGAGMLMHEVCDVYEGKHVKQRKDALASLLNLHLLGFYHGDARKENLVKFCSGLKWCDLQRAGKLDQLNPTLAQAKVGKDVLQLLTSLGYTPESSEQSGALLGQYWTKLSKASLEALVSAICPEFFLADREISAK
uniref:Protein kinase domain-containing protein n=1 Tax=Cryptomonas curvata TaxID=233186 RepID=A0A7S0MLK9_9CRYP